MKNGKTHYGKIFAILVVLLLSILISISLFPTLLDFKQDKIKLIYIILKIRLPEVLIAFTAGACLGLSGAIMQVILGNPLASPFTLGVSSASAFGAAIAISLNTIFGITIFTPSVFAFAFAIISLILLLLLIKLAGINQKNIILIGMALNFFFNAMNTFLQYFSTPDAVYQINFWTTGSLTMAKLSDSVILGVILIIAIIISLLFSKDLGLIQQGERNALMHGVNVNFERILFLTVCSLLASITVSIIGIIGFIGLVSPHISRLLKLESTKILLISSSLCGGILLILGDIISKTVIRPTILPISSVTAFMGIPILLILLFLRRKQK